MYAYVAHHPHASLVFHMSHFIPAMKWDKIFHECAFSTPFYVFSLIFISSYCNFDVHSVVVVHKRKSKRKTLKAMQQQAHSNCIEMKENAIGFTKKWMHIFHYYYYHLMCTLFVWEYNFISLSGLLAAIVDFVHTRKKREWEQLKKSNWIVQMDERVIRVGRAEKYDKNQKQKQKQKQNWYTVLVGRW